MIEAVIFDFDGVIVDTEPIHRVREMEVLRKFGIVISKEEYVKYRGMNYETICKDIAKTHPSKPDPKVLEAALMNGCVESYEKADAFDGAKELIEGLSGKFRMAIASSANRPEIVSTLERLGMSQFFKVIVSTDDIVNSKPDPEIFLKAAKALGISPGNCVVIEDATNGIRAANTAGMKSIGFVGNGEQDLSEAQFVVKALSEIPSIIPKL